MKHKHFTLQTHKNKHPNSVKNIFSYSSQHNFLTHWLLLICLLISSNSLAQAATTATTTNRTDTAAEAHASTQERQRVIILLGPPGSGKGTQAARLSKELNLPHISTGDLFRSNIQNKTELGKKAKSFTDAGKLVPDEIVLEMLFKRIAEPDSKNGYLLDGFPRTLEQAKALDKHLAATNAQVLVVNLDVDDETLLKRIAERASKSTVKRTDDKPEVAKNRLKVYHEQTEPLIEYYQVKKELINIKGEKGADAVFQEILKHYQTKMSK